MKRASVFCGYVFGEALIDVTKLSLVVECL